MCTRAGRGEEGERERGLREEKQRESLFTSSPPTETFQPPLHQATDPSNTMRSFARLARPLASAAAVPARSLHIAAAARPSFILAQQKQSAHFQQLRFASGGSLSKDAITSRVLEVLKSFEKVQASNVGFTYPSSPNAGRTILPANLSIPCPARPTFLFELSDLLRARQAHRPGT